MVAPQDFYISTLFLLPQNRRHTNDIFIAMRNKPSFFFNIYDCTRKTIKQTTKNE
jgi:hypothetical protein